MAYSLKDKVVFITGAAGGIGAATAEALYTKGALLVLTDMSQEAVDAQAQRYNSERVMALALDVTDASATAQAVEQAVQRFGRIDCVMANAGIAWRDEAATVASCDADEFEHIVAVDFLGVWRTIKACLPEVIRNQGQVLVVSSIYAMINGVANAPYAASKAAVESLARSLRVELAHTGASASVIYPGWVATPIIDVAFGGSPLATQMIETALPAFLRQPITPQTLAARIVKGVEKRQPHIVAPARWRPVFWLRGLANPATDALLAGHSKLQSLVAELDRLTASNVKRIDTARRQRAAQHNTENKS